ncbi:Rv1733c family protein [Streptomyces misionensis]|uniref:Rv1733c family protein n=1 Tax=Streptomyces misionensis TaxID=67331 RepID=UPI0033ADC807
MRGPRVWLWRWRRNPLRRRADVVEGWVVLGVWLLTVLAGSLTGDTVARSLSHGLAHQRAGRHPAVAHLVAKAPRVSAAHRNPLPGERVRAEVRWTAADGSARTGRVRVVPGSAAGTPVTVWTDRRGHLVAGPVTPGQAALRAAFLGGLAGAATALVPFGAGLLLRAHLDRRRLTAWDTEWARLGPQWGRRV